METLLLTVAPQAPTEQVASDQPCLAANFAASAPWIHDESGCSSLDDIECDEGSDLDDYAWIKWHASNDALSPRLFGQEAQAAEYQHDLLPRISRLSTSSISLSASALAELARLSQDIDVDIDLQLDHASDVADSLDAIDCEEDSALDDYDWIKWTQPAQTTGDEGIDLDLKLELASLPALPACAVQGSQSPHAPESPETPSSPVQSQSDVSSLFGAGCTL